MYDLLITNAKVWTLDTPGTLEKGWVAAKGGRIIHAGAGEPPQPVNAGKVIDAAGRHLLPGLTDCHTHLSEYATAALYPIKSEEDQRAAAIKNLTRSLQYGIVAAGEHHLGHPQLSMPMNAYKEIMNELELSGKVAYGCCLLGFEPKVLTSCTRPGEALSEDALCDDDYRKMAAASEFAGENLFLNYTCANAPLASAPYAGQTAYGKEKLQRIIGIFHEAGKPVGAHIEGDASALLFIQCGGDVIHHGHGITPAVGALMAEKKVALVVTPAAGTGRKPTSPREAYGFYRQGVFMALASDAYIPPHPEADWIPLPKDVLAGPREFLAVCGSTLRYFVRQGVSQEEALKLITVNGRKILSPKEPEAAIAPGRPADFILCDKIPALETEDPADIKMVVCNGKVRFSNIDGPEKALKEELKNGLSAEKIRQGELL